MIQIVTDWIIRNNIPAWHLMVAVGIMAIIVILLFILGLSLSKSFSKEQSEKTKKDILENIKKDIDVIKEKIDSLNVFGVDTAKAIKDKCDCLLGLVNENKNASIGTLQHLGNIKKELEIIENLKERMDEMFTVANKIYEKCDAVYPKTNISETISSGQDSKTTINYDLDSTVYTVNGDMDLPISQKGFNANPEYYEEENKKKEQEMERRYYLSQHGWNMDETGKVFNKNSIQINEEFLLTADKEEWDREINKASEFIKDINDIPKFKKSIF